MFIILIGPVLFERIRIPSIVGLLLSGALIGEHGFNLIPSELEFSLLGTMGLLYLMFLAGLEIDLIDFLENKVKSIFIGLASFLVPFILGFGVSYYLLDYSSTASWLIGAMLSSHTLISYPIMGRLGVVNKSIVTIIVGATIIADVLALISMELIINFSNEGVAGDSIFRLLLNFILFFIVVFLVIPRISRSFLNRYEGELGVQYIFVLVILLSSSAVALLLEIEPIIGAFFSGLVMNRLIINTSPLYKRIEFIGNNLFIPFFLISIGMLANFRVYIDEPRQIWLLLLLIFIAVSSKYIAAFISKLVFRLSGAESNLVFGLSVSRAASAVAIILVGLNLGIVDDSVLNNTVILILGTSILSTLITREAGKQILFHGNDTISGAIKIKQKILVPIANPENMEHLLEFAILMKDEEEGVPIYPLTVFTKRDEVRTKIDDNRENILKIVDSLHTDIEFETTSRIDNNVTNGIARAAEEVVATAIIMGWHKRNTPLYNIFGDKLKNLLVKTRRMLLVLKTPTDFRQVRRIHLFYPNNAQYEEGFSLWLDTILHLVKKLKLKILLYSDPGQTTKELLEHAKKKSAIKYFELVSNYSGKIEDTNIKHSASELLIFIHARKKTISFSRKYEHFMDVSINLFEDTNTIIIYPEQL